MGPTTDSSLGLRWHVIGYTVILVVMTLGLWAPRHIMLLPHNVTPSSDLDFRGWKAQSRNMESHQEAASSDQLAWNMVAWKTGGFPFDSYHQALTNDSSHLAIDWNISVLNVAINAIVVVALLLLALRQSRSLWHQFWQPLSKTTFRQRSIFGVTSTLVLTTIFWWGWQGFAQRQTWLHNPSVRCTSSLPREIEELLPVSLAELWTHPLAIKLTSKSELTDGSGDRWNDWQPKSIQFLWDTTRTDHDDLTRLANRFPLVHSIAGPTTSVRPDRLRWPDRIRTLKITRSDTGPQHRLDCSGLKNLQAFSSVRVGWDTFASQGFPSGLVSLHCELPSTDAIEIECLPALEELRLVVDSKVATRPTDAFAITAADLPSLKRLLLPTNVDLDLALTNLPNLAELVAVDSSLKLVASRIARGRGGPPRGGRPPGGLRDFGFHGPLDPPRPRMRTPTARLNRSIDRHVLRLNSIRVANAPRLASLTAKVGDRAQIDLGRAENLHELHLTTHWQPGTRGKQPTATWLANLGTIKSLRRVTLQGFNLRHADFSGLASLPLLTSLDLADSEGHANSLERFSDLRFMRQLVAPKFDLQESTVQHLTTSNRNWERLILNWNQLNRMEITDLPRLTSVVSPMTIQCETVILRNLPRLNDTLKLSRRRRTRQASEHSDSQVVLDHLSSLPRLVMQDHSLANTTLRRLPKLAEVTIFNGGNVTPASWDSLKHLHVLNRLSLDSCQLAPVYVFDHDWSSLRELELAKCGITDSQLVASTGLTKLRRLILDQTDVGPDSVMALRHMHQLQLLSVSDTGLGKRELEALDELPMLVAIVADHIELFPESLRDKRVTQARIRETLDVRDNLRLGEQRPNFPRPSSGRRERRGV